jgi:hypothetical protein
MTDVAHYSTAQGDDCGGNLWIETIHFNQEWEEHQTYSESESIGSGKAKEFPYDVNSFGLRPKGELLVRDVRVQDGEQSAYNGCGHVGEGPDFKKRSE